MAGESRVHVLAKPDVHDRFGRKDGRRIGVARKGWAVGFGGNEFRAGSDQLLTATVGLIVLVAVIPLVALGTVRLMVAAVVVAVGIRLCLRVGMMKGARV